MKRTILVIFLALLLVSCGGAAPTPTPTPGKPVIPQRDETPVTRANVVKVAETFSFVWYWNQDLSQCYRYHSGYNSSNLEEVKSSDCEYYINKMKG